MTFVKHIRKPEEPRRSCTMTSSPHTGTSRPRWTAVTALGVATGVLLLMGALPISTAYAAEAPVGLGTAATYSVLGGQTVTNTGPSTLSGDLGVSPGSAITGFPPGVVGGAIHAADAQAGQAQSDLTTAYDDAAGRAPTANIGAELAGTTLTAGVYKSSGPTGIGVVAGTLTLNGQGDPNAVFIFQIADTLITSSAATISLTNSAQACHVYWQVASSATLGTGSSFVGTIMALTSVSVTTGATVDGRALARNGSVTLDTNTFTNSPCRTGPGPTATTTSATRSATSNATGSATGTTASATTSAPGSVTSTSPVAETGSPTGSLLTMAALVITAGFAMLLVSRRLVTARHRR